MGFVASNNLSKISETCLVQTLEKCGFKCERAVGHNKFWDIEAVLNNQTIYFELKYDRMSMKTQNLAIEYHNPRSDKPSGIYATQSDFWAFAFNEPLELWMAPVDDIKFYIENNKPLRTVTTAGDNNASLYLYRRDELLNDIFLRIDNLECKALLYTIKQYIDMRNKNYLEGHK